MLRYNKVILLALASIILVGTVMSSASAATVYMGVDTSYIDSSAHWDGTYSGTPTVSHNDYVVWENDLWNMAPGTSYHGRVSYKQDGSTKDADNSFVASYNQVIVMYPAVSLSPLGGHKISEEVHKYSSDGIHWDQAIKTSPPVSHDYNVI